jgi:catechol 2,3-dioxygenase-like lactoylglutathione lyase family enzyme
MAIQRMEHVGIVVDDLADAVAFFVELGLELRGEAPVEGDWVDRVVGLEGGAASRMRRSSASSAKPASQRLCNGPALRGKEARRRCTRRRPGLDDDAQSVSL